MQPVSWEQLHDNLWQDSITLYTHAVSKMIDISEAVKEAMSRKYNQSDNDRYHRKSSHIAVTSSKEWKGEDLKL